jgi:predicted nucleic acid-binding protein
MTVLIDSIGWIEHFSSSKLGKKYFAHTKAASIETHITPSIVIYEVYRALRKTLDEEEVIKALAYIKGYTKIVDFDYEISISAVDLSLKHKLSMADSIIYATALRYNAKLVTSDLDLKGLPYVIYIK